jgi:LAO/AO transport system kinase
MLVCEAAGYDVVLVETVGVGQSEFEVRSMVDFFCVLLQPGAGDELQGIKKGVLELADLLLVNKADGEQLAEAARTQAEYTHALGLLHPTSEHWSPRVQTASALTGDGVDAFWQAVLEHEEALFASGERELRRREQAGAWLWRLLREGLESAFREHPAVREALPGLEQGVKDQDLTAPHAARQLLDTFRR